jgi:uncharacterized phage protein (TIGR01671 family)
MREIRFRAWHKKDNKMYWVRAIHFDGYLDLDGDEEFSTFQAPLDQVDLMQYTGLLDKNGKQIWEGDLMTREGEDWKDLVTFKDGAFLLDDGGGVYDNFIGAGDLDFVVIGNCFENPELLETINKNIKEREEWEKYRDKYLKSKRGEDTDG